MATRSVYSTQALPERKYKRILPNVPRELVERELLISLARGYSSKEIAYLLGEMFVSFMTIKQVDAIKVTLSLRWGLEKYGVGPLLVQALKRGVIRLEDV